MRRLIIAAAALIAVVSLAPTKLEAGKVMPKIVPAGPPGHVGALPWALMACPALIVFTGAVANFKDNRQLTFWEAWTCGLAYWFWVPGQMPPKARTH
ncbi:hypothetical protein SAMN05414138_1173 [Rhodoplanes sp. JGI PP 4-B12]|nr:hypothetical protein SAMN05414138_1173 [Rhodoplanes sp. JGI PP 4-B12]